jgi:hypothetical protein
MPPDHSYGISIYQRAINRGSNGASQAASPVVMAPGSGLRPARETVMPTKAGIHVFSLPF